MRPLKNCLNGHCEEHSDAAISYIISKVAYLLKFDPGTIVVDGRGYNDYHLFAKWTSEEVCFVTRMKDNALYTVIETREVPKNRPILKDEIILFTGSGAAEKGCLQLVTFQSRGSLKDEPLYPS